MERENQKLYDLYITCILTHMNQNGDDFFNKDFRWVFDRVDVGILVGMASPSQDDVHDCR